MQTTHTPTQTRSEPGKLIYSRWLIVLLGISTSVLLAERMIIHRLRPGAEETIRLQLDALKEADFGEAYRYASDGIRGRIDVPQFREMIQRDFPEFVRWRSVKIAKKQLGKTTSRFEVAVTGSAGRVLNTIYLLSVEDGYWRINGVIPTGPPRSPSSSDKPEVTT